MHVELGKKENGVVFFGVVVFGVSGVKQRVHEEANLLWMIMCDGNGERSEYAMCAIFFLVFLA